MRKREAAGHLATSLFPHVVFWGLMVWTLGIPAWVTLAMAVPATGLLGWTFVALRAYHPAEVRGRR